MKAKAKVPYNVYPSDGGTGFAGPLVEASNAPMLALVTCYPFDVVVLAGALRHVVTAVARES